MNVTFSDSAFEEECPFKAILILVGVISFEKRFGATEGGGNVDDGCGDDEDDGDDDVADLYGDDDENKGADMTVVGATVRCCRQARGCASSLSSENARVKQGPFSPAFSVP